MRTDSLLPLLEAEGAALRECLSVLAEEQALLSRSAEVEGLPALATRKAALHARLDSIAAARAACFDGAIDMAAALSHDARLQPLWDDVTELARRARAANETNGRLVRMRMHYTGAALDALRQARGQQAPVYGPDGRFSSR